MCIRDSDVTVLGYQVAVEPFFIFKVQIERTETDAGFIRDILDAGTVIPLVEEHLFS